MSAVLIPQWPDEIRVDVLSPLAILRQVEPTLKERTKGILTTEITTTSAKDVVEHHLDLIAPLIEYRITILAARHHSVMVYPVTVKSRAFAPAERGRVADIFMPGFSTIAAISAITKKLSEPPDDERDAASQQEFAKLVQEVLHSPYVRALVNSLIARSNDSNGNGTAIKGTSP
jgi:hypothetical protein